MSLADKFLGAALILTIPGAASAAELPDHDPLRLLVVSDAVNPHGLSDADLTQPNDLVAALSGAGNGLNIESVEGVDSQCIDDALAALSTPGEVDVIVYFAHLAATGCDGSPQQTDFTAAVASHLESSGGVVVFHHGIFESAGKEGILQLLGGRAGSIAWDTGAGQDVIGVGAGHFVVDQAVDYSGMRGFEGVGVPGGEYPFFNNTPDERYNDTAMLTQGGEDRTILFTSADAGGGAARVLGYDLHRPEWMGHVVFYQPGEYQPAALDDVDGNNFQILANSIYYAATTMEEGGGDGTGDTTGDVPGDSGDPDDSDDGPSGATDGADGSTTATSATGTSDGPSVVDEGGEDGGTSGCSCRTDTPPRWGLGLLALGLLGLRRRR